MQGFDLEQLKTLVAAVDSGSLTAAAPLRHLSQSSLSEQLRKLEERAGQALLLRGKAGVRPTAAGERLLAHARQILALSDAAWRDLHGVPLAGELRLGISDYFRPAELVGLLARLARQYPGLRVHTQMGRSDELLDAHARGALDLALVMALPDTPLPAVEGLQVLREEPLVWACAREAGLPAAEVLPLVLLPASCSLHRLACAALQAQGRPYVVAHVASGVAGLQAAVRAGLGVACLNASAVAGAGLVACSPGGAQAAQAADWPALPAVRFVLLPPQAQSQLARGAPGTADLVQTVAEALAR